MHCNFVASRAAAFFIASFAVVVLASCQTVSAVEKILLAEGLEQSRVGRCWRGWPHLCDDHRQA